MTSSPHFSSCWKLGCFHFIFTHCMPTCLRKLSQHHLMCCTDADCCSRAQTTLLSWLYTQHLNLLLALPLGCFQLLWSKISAAASKLRVRILEWCECSCLEWEAFLCTLLNTALSAWELHKLPSLGKVPYRKWAVIKISTISKILLDVHIPNGAGAVPNMVQLTWSRKCLLLRGRVMVAVLKNFF